MVSEKTYTKDNPLVVTRKDIEQFRALFPESNGLLELFVKKGLLVIKD